MIDLEVHFSLIFHRFWEGFGRILEPSWPPKSRKIYKKKIICCMLFLIEFLLILGASWVDFWWILGAKLWAMLTKKSILIGKTEKSDFLILA